MSDQKELYRQTALWLRDLACRFIERAAGIEDTELKRKLMRRAFELVQEAVALEPFVDQAEPGSLSLSVASHPAAHTAVPASRRRSTRPMATRAIVDPQPIRPTVRGAGPVLQTFGASAFPKESERHTR
jgi:hypothetical protein